MGSTDLNFVLNATEGIEIQEGSQSENIRETRAEGYFVKYLISNGQRCQGHEI